jgi:hypothetical protein
VEKISIGKRSLAAGGKDQHREKIISCWTQRTPLGALRAALLRDDGIQKPTKLGL